MVVCIAKNQNLSGSSQKLFSIAIAKTVLQPKELITKS